jgi:hypothetical protein
LSELAFGSCGRVAEYTGSGDAWARRICSAAVAGDGAAAHAKTTAAPHSPALALDAFDITMKNHSKNCRYGAARAGAGRIISASHLNR